VPFLELAELGRHVGDDGLLQRFVPREVGDGEVAERALRAGDGPLLVENGYST
jgi:hypothetical protein